MKKKILAIILSLAMVVSMTPAISFAGTGGDAEAPAEVVLDSTEEVVVDSPEEATVEQAEKTQTEARLSEESDEVELAAEEGTKEKPWNISAEEEGNLVFAYLEANKDTKILHIYGKGNMRNWDKGETPFYSAKESITTVVFDDEYEIPGGDKQKSDITSIGDYAFSDLEKLETINIPGTVTELGEYLFKNDTKLPCVLKIPDSVKTIKNDAFNDVYAINYTRSDADAKLTWGADYRNPTLESFKDGQFYSAKNSAGNNAFIAYFGSETEIKIPDGIVEIGKKVFDYNDKISKYNIVYLPDTVNEVKDTDPFKKVISIMSNNLAASATFGAKFRNADFNTGSGFFTMNEGKKIVYYLNDTNRTEIKIPEGINEISGAAFKDATSLKKVSISDTVSVIGAQAFYNIPITTIIPNTVTSVATDAFAGAKAVALSGDWSGKTSGSFNFPSEKTYWLPDATVNSGITASQLYSEGSDPIKIFDETYFKVSASNESESGSLGPASELKNYDSLAVTTKNGTVTFNKEALEKIAKNASSGESVTLTLENDKSPKGGAGTSFDIYLKDTASIPKTVSFEGDGAKARVKINYTKTGNGKLKVYLLGSASPNYPIENMNASYDAVNNVFEFDANHFSHYGVYDEGGTYTGTLATDKISMKTDEEVTVTVGVTPNEVASTVYGAQFTLNYDTSKYEFVNSSLGEGDYLIDADGNINATKLFSSARTGAQNLATFTFKAKGQEKDNVDSYFTLSGMKIAPTNAMITIDFTDAIPAAITSGTTNASKNVNILWNEGLASKLNIPLPATRTFNYDGTEHTIAQITVDPVKDADVTIKYGTVKGDYKYNAAVVTATNAGTYTQYYYATKPGYYPVEDSYDLIIKKIPLTVIWNCSNGETWPYSGSAITGPTAIVSGFITAEIPNPTTDKYEVKGNKETEIGDYTAVLEFKNGEWQRNYVMPTDLTREWSIVKGSGANPTTVTVNTSDYPAKSGAGVVDTYEKTYNGTKAVVANINAIGTMGTNEVTWYVNNVNVGSEIPSLKNAGTYYISYRILNSNYAEMNGSFVIIISQKEVTLSWTGDTGLVYNGKVQCPSATATGIEAGDTCTCTVVVAETATPAVKVEPINARDYTATVTELSNPNYKLPTNTTKTFTIERKALAINATSASKKFGEEDPVFTGTETGFVNDIDRMTADVKYHRTNTAEAPTTYPGVITATKSEEQYETLLNNNYDVTITSAAFTITKDGINVCIDTVSDYTSGKSLVLVFTDSDKVAYRYGTDESNFEMFELKGFGYKASNNKNYSHLFAYVVDGTPVLDNVKWILRSDVTPSIEYTTDINGSGELDVNDVVAVNGVYNNNAGSSQATMLRANYVITANTPNNNTVNVTDQNRIRTEVINSMK